MKAKDREITDTLGYTIRYIESNTGEYKIGKSQKPKDKIQRISINVQGRRWCCLSYPGAWVRYIESDSGGVQDREILPKGVCLPSLTVTLHTSSNIIYS
jgi:hypothetical protein